MTETKSFHIGDIISVMHDRLMSPDHIGGVYNILGWMVDEDLMTHQLPRVARECEPYLRNWFPDIAELDVFTVTITGEDDLIAWFESIKDEMGTHREVPRLPKDAHTHMNPLVELVEMRNKPL